MKKNNQGAILEGATIDQSFDPEEAQRRFEAALRGARVASPHPMTEFVGKGKSAMAGVKGRTKAALTRPK